MYRIENENLKILLKDLNFVLDTVDPNSKLSSAKFLDEDIHRSLLKRPRVYERD